MFVNFGLGKCPLCGDFGNRLPKSSYSCKKCNVQFDKYCLYLVNQPGDNNKFWN